MQPSLYHEIAESAQFIKERINSQPKIAIILGTGLGSLTDRIEILKEISYKLIPHFVPTTVESHSGKLIWAKWNGTEVLILSGRLHYYEGYSPQEITFPVRVLKALGIITLWMTNASGTVNPELNAGEIVFISDHINFHPENPLRGLHDERLGLRFPDMSDIYDKSLLEKAKMACQKKQLNFRTAVYFGLQGPSLETPAEYRMIRILGADIVGMSTVPEAIVAHHSGLTIMAASIVSNSTSALGATEKTTIESVIATIHASSEKLFDVLECMLQEA